ncbi:MAG: hypothetical protein AVDCRST_MAG90-2918 [uncultured Microvirga sp.]|uniref:DUF1440 domain-containing protein n=1 Tax=uncultured Microvirga sp. TaxID=412392 RepID=A0A6J4MMY9_9HYPH|nr:MAG: hypothetical protein AVDCRST_MAG90-2918 [uncultured Microvirga sp.]
MRYREPDPVGVGLMKGALAGVIATWVMDRVDWAMYRREDPASRRRTWAARPEGKDPAHVIASRASEAMGYGSVPQNHPAGTAVQYAIGVAPAAIYGAMRDRVPGVGAGRGLAFGFAMFVAEDEVANPLMGFAAPPHRYPWQPHARGLVSHLVYGLVADAVLTGLNRAFRPEPVRYRRPG